MPEPETKKIRVLRVIARLNVGGPAKHVAWLMSGLDPERFEQRLIAGPVPANEDDMGPWLQAQGAAYATLPSLQREISPARDAAALGALLRELARFRPHILATHTAKAGFLGRAALLLYRPYARLRGWPAPKAVHTFHGHTFHGYFGPAKTRLFLFLERFLAKNATWRIVAISPRMFREIHQQYRVGRAGQFVTVPLGIDLDVFRETGAGRASFRRELEAGPEEFLVGAVGRIAPVKNYGLFLEAAARLRGYRPELFAKTRFLLIGGGSGEDMAELKRRSRELGLGPKMVFLGNRPDPENFFPGLDALLLTSLNEGTPVAILEGGACGLPVAATGVGGVPDLLGEKISGLAQGFELRERGLTAPSCDADGLAAALAWIMDNPAPAEDLGRELRRYVRAAHGRDRLVSDISGLYLSGPD